MRVLGERVDLDGLVADAVEEGRTVRVVRGGGSKAATLAAFSEALNFPEWFGMNLDALADCLDTLARESAGQGEWEIIWDHEAALRREDPDASGAIADVLADAERAHPNLHVTILER